MARRDLTEAQRRDLMVTQANLTQLAQHPAWEYLVAEVEKHKAKIERTVVARALHTQRPLSPEEQAYYGGFLAGMRWFLAVPSGAEGRLERFLRSRGETPTTEEEEEDAA